MPFGYHLSPLCSLLFAKNLDILCFGMKSTHSAEVKTLLWVFSICLVEY